MTMLEILRKRLPNELEIISVKEKRACYEITFGTGGKQVKTSLQKTCAPGMSEKVVDFSICLVMCQASMEAGDLEKAKEWMDKQRRLTNHDD